MRRRKSVYDDLDTLRDYGMEIRKVSGKNGGYYVPERDFALSELKLLVDAVQAARFLSEKESMALIRKLAALSSAHGGGAAAARGRRYRPRQKRQRGRLPAMSIRCMRLSPGTAASRSATLTGICTAHSFRPKTYEASPIALCWEDELLSVVAAGAPHGLTHYRVDEVAGDRGDGRPAREQRRDALL